MPKRITDLLERSLTRGALTAELILSMRQLSIMHTSGIPVARSLRILSEQATHKALRKAFSDCQRAVESGRSISSAFSEFPDIFPELYMRLIEVGEHTGKLSLVLESLATHAERAHNSALRLQAALVYPVFVLIISIAFLIIGPAYLLRGMFDFLNGLHVSLPLMTQVLIKASAFMRSPYFPLSVLLAAALSTTAAHRMWRDIFWRRYMQKALLSLPGIGPYYRSLQMTVFTRALALVSESGMSLLPGMELVKRSVGLLALQSELDKAARHVQEGESLHEALTQTGFFPPLVLQFIKAGEESGDLGKMLRQSAWVCEQNNTHTLEILTEALQPFVLLVMGVIVGFLIIATMSPMLKVIQELS